jgi:acyl carrier protein
LPTTSDAAAGENVPADIPADVLAKIRSIIATQLKVPESKVTPDAKLTDLGDSLDLIEVLYALEVTFGIDIQFDVQKVSAEKVETVADVARRIVRLAAEKKDKA